MTDLLLLVLFPLRLVVFLSAAILTTAVSGCGSSDSAGGTGGASATATGGQGAAGGQCEGGPGGTASGSGGVGKGTGDSGATATGGTVGTGGTTGTGGNLGTVGATARRNWGPFVTGPDRCQRCRNWRIASNPMMTVAAPREQARSKRRRRWRAGRSRSARISLSKLASESRPIAGISMPTMRLTFATSFPILRCVLFHLLHLMVHECPAITIIFCRTATAMVMDTVPSLPAHSNRAPSLRRRRQSMTCPAGRYSS